jgi:hypothetical protein
MAGAFAEAGAAQKAATILNVAARAASVLIKPDALSFCFDAFSSHDRVSARLRPDSLSLESSLSRSRDCDDISAGRTHARNPLPQLRFAP